MRSSILLVAVLTSASFLPAQHNGFYTNYPDDQLLSSSWIARGPATPTLTACEVLNEMPSGMVAGVGMDGTGNCFLSGMFVVLQDQNAATVETFGIVARPRDAAGTGPDTAVTIFNAGGLQTPAGSGIAAWSFTITFQTAQQVPSDSYFYGVSLPAAPNWPATDGLSPHQAHYLTGTLGEHGKNGTLGYGRSIETSTSTVSRINCDWAVELRSASPTFQWGANDPANTRTSSAAGQGPTTFGVGGMFPDVGGAPRRDGIDVRIVDANNPNAPTAVLISFGLAPVPIPFPGVVGNVLLDLGTLLVFNGGATSATLPARAIFPFLPANSIPVTLSGTRARMFGQAAVIDPAVGIKLTNAQALQL